VVLCTQAVNWQLLASIPFRLIDMNIQKLLADLTSGAAQLTKGSKVHPAHTKCGLPAGH
jgi:hypothetical protein